MSETDRFAANSIEELLVAIAEGVREAQEALNASPPTDAFGRPMPTYQIPYLDFEIKVDVQTETNSGGRPVVRLLNLRPQAAAPNTTSSSSRSSTQSTISGRLVAIPPGEGLPVPQLSITVRKVKARMFGIDIRASNSAGELLVGQPVEINIDQDASTALSSVNGVTLAQKRDGTVLSDAVVVTDGAGQASTQLTLAAGEPDAAVFVVSAQIGRIRASVSLTADNSL